MRNALSLFICVIFLSACATTYQPFQLFGTGGYTESQVGVATYQVSYYGNHVTSMETLNTLLLYRCAELTLEKGYDGFQITRGYGRQPISSMGGFRSVKYVIVMHGGAPQGQGDQSYDARAVLQEFGPYAKKSS
ncbi:hypothetical protein [Vogesella sp. AC12]|uniref:CC0125/CC1285 family lipoprotein n=1 Tax=Vogesella sp. AC12 TaxID=2950550 RepID=UPI00210E6E19|nr:hypothetical protein [Vogesella sp. AC12]MCQ4143193.1 hypothetical protein [Vogesella sp. AC12]